MRKFTGASLARIAFPIGGIGTGTVSVGGRGNLQDWEIFNKPAKGYNLDRTFVALRIAPQGGKVFAATVERKYLPPFDEALGFQNQRFAGLPRFREATFAGEYPFAEIAFADARCPCKVEMEAFNPFIPMNVKDSSIPGMMLTYRVRNTSGARAAISLLATMQNPIGIVRPGGWLGPGVHDRMFAAPPELEETRNEYREAGGLKGVFFTMPGAAHNSIHRGSASLATSFADADCQTHLHRGLWWDGLHILWDCFRETGRLEPVLTPRFGEPHADERKHRWEAAALCLHAAVEPDEDAVFPLYLNWHFPNGRLWGGDTAVAARTHVANDFADSWGAAEYMHANRARLEADTRSWRDSFYGSSLPAEILDAAGSQIVTLRSQTVQRLSDGNIYAWEGCQDSEGSCSGNCTHVWNYEQTLAFLFLELERTIRRIEFGPNMHPDGAMAFRCEAPAGSAATTSFAMPPCVDGQMGAIVQAYRDWQLSQGEAGLILCSWPSGGRPRIPFVYSEEVWTGIEYQVAAHLIYEEMVEEARAIVRAARSRYDGIRRNPFDEIECGHHYARALSSWSLIQAMTGARYSAVEKSLTFEFRQRPPARAFVALGTAWGDLSVTAKEATLSIRYGDVELKTFGPRDAAGQFDPPRRLKVGDSLSVALRRAEP